MSTSRSVCSPWSIFKRIKVKQASAQQPQHRAALSTTLSLHQDTTPVQASIDKQITKGPQHLGNRPQDDIRQSLLEIATYRNITPPPILQSSSPESGAPRLPRSVQALYLLPLRRTPTHGIPVCNLQLRSYSVRNLEFMADFALRAAYYLNLPAKGPVPLPRITERWTVPRANFVFKKSQENWERITLRRLVQVQDGHPEVVRRWLGFVKRWCWYGVGMKADVWEWEGVGTAARMDGSEEAVRRGVESVDWELFGRRKGMGGKEEVEKLLEMSGFADEPGVRQTRDGPRV